MRPTLGLDLDGVIVDFERMWMEKFNAEFGTDYRPGMVDSWDWRKNNVDLKGEGFWKWAKRSKLWSGVVPIYPGELKAARQLHKKWSVVIVTSKPDWAHRDVLIWLDGTGIQHNGVIFSSFRGVRKHQIGLDAYVDDSPHNISNYVELTSGEVYRMVRKWNDPVLGARDIHSLKELL